MLASLRLDAFGSVLTHCNDADLRAMVAAGGTIRLSCDGTIALTNEITVGSDVVLDATGHEVVLSGRGSNRLFRIQAGKTLTLIHLTLADGVAAGTNGNLTFAGESGVGGAILNQAGVLRAVQCSFVTNSARGGNGGNSGFYPVLAGRGGDGFGGAVFNDGGELYLTNTIFQGNLCVGGGGGRNLWASGGSAGGGSVFGGAIFSRDGILVVDRGAFNSNISVSGVAGETKGGAVFNTNTTLKLVNSVFSSNACIGGSGGRAAGGGISQVGGQLEVTASFFQMNSATGGSWQFRTSEAQDGRGGALFLVDSTNTISACSFQSNLATGGNGNFVIQPWQAAGMGSGGAIHASALLTVFDTAFFGNSARRGTELFGFWGSGLGGALFNDAGTVELTHVTMVSNAAVILTAISPGPPPLLRGGAVDAANGSTVLRNSILAFSQNSRNAFGNIIDGGGNISSDSTPVFTMPDSRNNLDPQLGTFGNHGGPTPTISLLPGSPAIDAGSALWCSTVDQRGYPRTFGSGCDIGAFEFWSSLQLTYLQLTYLPPGEVEVRWPTNQNCTVESTTSLSVPRVWTPQTNPTPTLANDQFVLTLPATNPATFFRLRCP